MITHLLLSFYFVWFSKYIDIWYIYQIKVNMIRENCSYNDDDSDDDDDDDGEMNNCS